MTAKDQKPKARLPRGFSDRTAAEIRATERMVAAIRAVYERYGFEPVETPLIEYTDALGKFLPDQDRPNEGVFSFRDEDAQEARSAAKRTSDVSEVPSGATGKQEEWLSLRYDLTAPLARHVAENYERLPKPYRTYRWGWVFRNEKPGPGRFRQFMQFDADTVGAASPAADAEMCMMAADTMEALGFKKGEYVIKVNSRKVLDGVMEAIGVTDERQKLTVLRAIDKLDRLGVEGVRDLLGVGRKDESGDFTKGAGLSDPSITLVLHYLEAAYDEGAAFNEKYQARLRASHSWNPGMLELHQLRQVYQAAGYHDGRILINFGVVRGLEYYTGAVFEAELLFDVPNERGEKVVFGSVGGGGRYDGLVGRFMGENVPATGFSLGVSRLQAALAALGKIDTKDGAGPVIVLVMDRGRVGDYQRIVARLREADIPAEMYLGSSGMKAQMKYADRRSAPLVVIQGEAERGRTPPAVQIKDLRLGKKLAANVADNAQWREERPGQEEVAEANLVEAVARMLGRAT